MGKEEPKYNYSKQKNGWVKIPEKRKKVKLRKYIKELAKGFNKYPELTFNQKVTLFIDGWNENGLDGLRIVHHHLAEVTTEYVKKKVSEISVEYNEIKANAQRVLESLEEE